MNRNFFQIALLLAMLAFEFCTFPAGTVQAQVIANPFPQFNSTAQVQTPDNNTSYWWITDYLFGFTAGETNINTHAEVAGASASGNVYQKTQFLPLQFSCSSSVNASSSASATNYYNAHADAYSSCDTGFQVTAPVRFTLTASASFTVSHYTDGYSDANLYLHLQQYNPGSQVFMEISQYVYGGPANLSIATNLAGVLMPGEYAIYGDIRVVLQNNQFSGSETGSAACDYLMTFDPLPANDNEILAGLLNGGGMRFTYVGLAGTNYALDRTFNLSPPINWVPQLTNTADASGVIIFTNTPVATNNNFWRIRSVP